MPRNCIGVSGQFHATAALLPEVESMVLIGSGFRWTPQTVWTSL
jgi:hypothetical protein